MMSRITTFILMSATMASSAAAQLSPDYFRGGSSLDSRQVEQNEARKAAEAGRNIRLSDINKKLRQRYGGELLDAELFERNGDYLYAINWQTADGNRINLVVDAKDGRILSDR